MGSVALKVAISVAISLLAAACLVAWRSGIALPFTRTRTIAITPPDEMPAGHDFTYRLLRVCAGESDGRAFRLFPIRRFKFNEKGQLQLKLRATMQEGLQFKCFVEVTDEERSLEQYEKWMATVGWANPRFDRDLEVHPKRVWFLLPNEQFRLRDRKSSQNNFLQPATKNR